MQIDLPPETVDLANSLTTADKDAAAVIGEALARLAWERQEVAAVIDGSAAYERGDHQSLEDCDRELRREFGISPDA